MKIVLFGLMVCALSVIMTQKIIISYFVKNKKTQTKLRIRKKHVLFAWTPSLIVFLFYAISASVLSLGQPQNKFLHYIVGGLVGILLSKWISLFYFKDKKIYILEHNSKRIPLLYSGKIE